MAIVGHWSTLAEAQKLVQDELLAGVVEEIIEEGQLTAKLPVFQIDSKTVKYNRESVLPSAAFYDINEQLPWNAEVAYTTQVEVELKRVARQDVLDQFMRDTYRNPNDYRSIVLSEMRKGCMRAIEDKIIYGDTTYTSSKEFDGLHAFAALNDTGGAADGVLDIDEGEGALSLANMRLLMDSCKVGYNGMPSSNIFWLTGHELGRRIDAMLQEAGIASYAVPFNMVFTANELGRRVTMFDGIPIVRSDYMVAEQVNTGRGTNARAKYTSGTKQYSIFLCRLGQIMEGGLCMAFGGTGVGAGEFFTFRDFPDLEDYDAEGMRLKAYVALALGSTKSLGRIHDITDAPPGA